ncbi:MAG: non-canonical purine NTP pyrophosphatase [Chloroflexi bacterium]|nr:non-canonical purine NTP pyrophosphatase [Chloroflexota bacterium]
MGRELPLLLLGTTSQGKIRELRELLADLPARIVVPADLGIDLDVVEGETSFVANAMLKARAFRRASKVLTVAEDSGFEVDALNGEPGVISARWGGTDYSVKNQLIVDRLAGLPPAQRACRYVTVLAVAALDGKVYRRTGTCEGQVAERPAGDGGFGYDPIFYVPQLGKTMAEIPQTLKGTFSHRGRAATKALPLLRLLLAK